MTVSRRIVSFGGGGEELFLKQGLFSGGMLRRWCVCV